MRLMISRSPVRIRLPLPFTGEAMGKLQIVICITIGFAIVGAVGFIGACIYLSINAIKAL